MKNLSIKQLGDKWYVVYWEGDGWEYYSDKFYTQRKYAQNALNKIKNPNVPKIEIGFAKDNCRKCRKSFPRPFISPESPRFNPDNPERFDPNVSMCETCRKRNNAWGDDF